MSGDTIKAETLTLIEGVFNTAQKIDPAITPKKVKDIMRYLTAGGDTPEAEVVQVVSSTRQLDEVLSRADAAKMLHISPRYVTSLAARGKIRKIGFGVAGRAVGYSLESVQRLIKESTAGKGVRK